MRGFPLLLVRLDPSVQHSDREEKKEDKYDIREKKKEKVSDVNLVHSSITSIRLSQRASWRS